MNASVQPCRGAVGPPPLLVMQSVALGATVAAEHHHAECKWC